VNCITCLNPKVNNLGKIIYKKLYVCDDCIYKILTIYLNTNNFKWICPKCKGEKDSKCEWCDLSKFLKEIKCL